MRGAASAAPFTADRELAMAKRRIRFELGEIKISGLKIEIDDELDAANAAFGAAQHLVAGAIQPAFAQAIVKGQQAGKLIEGTASSVGEGQRTSAPRNTRSISSGRKKPASGSDANVLPYTHDPDKYGNPSIEWSTAQKALWTLWALQESADIKEMTSTQIVDVLSKYFREFSPPNRQNVTRDLGKEKKKNPPTVGFSPDTGGWFLYDPGKTAAKALAHPTGPTPAA